MSSVPSKPNPGRGSVWRRPLPPPDLVIQDELHLIAGPLGTMAGLYETAIEALAVREVDGRRIKPKILAAPPCARTQGSRSSTAIRASGRASGATSSPAAW